MKWSPHIYPLVTKQLPRATMITNLPRNPAPSYYLDGMELGSGIDAITGETTEGAIDQTFKVEDVVSTGSRDSFSFRLTKNVSDLESNDAIGLSSSVTFPTNGMKVGQKRSSNSSASEKMSTSVSFIILDWERVGGTKRISGAKLSPSALCVLQNNRDDFRRKFGDYFVYQISHRVKFRAVW